MDLEFSDYLKENIDNKNMHIDVFIWYSIPSGQNCIFLGSFRVKSFLKGFNSRILKLFTYEITGKERVVAELKL